MGSIKVAIVVMAIAGSTSSLPPHPPAHQETSWHDQVQRTPTPGADSGTHTGTHNTAPNPAVVNVLTNVKGATAHVYGLTDSTGGQMASLHLLDAHPTDAEFYGVYMTNIGRTFEVRVGSSTDLIAWRSLTTLVPNADMPYATSLGDSGWILLVHEQWMNPSSSAPCRLGFKLYYNRSEFLAGNHFHSFVAPLTVGAHSHLEGTPNIYNASLVFRDGFYMVDAEVGFHFNDVNGVDQVAQGSLRSFGPTVVTPEWTTSAASGYDAAFKRAGAIGNIGQRDAGILGGSQLVVQEGNVGHAPPTVWKDWRVWLYTPAPGERMPPSGNGSITQLAPITGGGSTAFGNPSFKTVPCPKSRNTSCVFVSYFIFGEGAAPGEAGVVAFYSPAPHGV